MGMKMQPAKRDSVALSEVGRACRSLVLGSAIGLAVGSACGQANEASAAGSGALNLQTRLSVSQTFTDNLRLSADALRDQALITTVAPGVSISSRSGALRGNLDYSLSGLVYMKTQQPDQTQQSLNAQATFEAVPGWFFIDGRASIGQQAVSAFGVAAIDPGLVNSNRTEVATLSVSPYIRGRAAGAVDYELRADAAESRAKGTQTGDVRTRGGLFSLKGTGDGLGLNWNASLRGQQQLPHEGRETETLTASIGLNYRPDIDWRVGGTIGRQRSDLQSSAARDGTTYGLNASWTPTPRTTMSADWADQVFGRTHALSLEHRWARASVRLSDSRSVTSGILGGTGSQTNYDLLFLQFASIEPDPIKRDQLVRQYLQNNGLNAGATVTPGFLSSAPNLTRRQDVSMSWANQRSTATLGVNQSRSRNLSQQSVGSGNVTPTSAVLQRGYSLTFSHRLTPDSSASVVLLQQQSRGDSANQSTDLKSITANWSAKLGRRSSIQLGTRHSNFDSAARQYRENAVLATFIQQF